MASVPAKIGLRPLRPRVLQPWPCILRAKGERQTQSEYLL